MEQASRNKMNDDEKAVEKSWKKYWKAIKKYDIECSLSEVYLSGFYDGRDYQKNKKIKNKRANKDE